MRSGENFLRVMSVDIDRIEQMFEYGSMSPTLTLHSSHTLRAVQVDALREKIRSLETPRMNHPVYPVVPGYEALFPEGGMRRGGVYETSGHRTLLWSLVAPLTQAGYCVALVGVTHLGVRSAKDSGVDLERVVLVNQPGNYWWHAVTLLADAVSVVVVQPAGPLPPPGHRDRFQARLRERGASALVLGKWPGADGSIAVQQSTWRGLGRGAGVLQEQRLRVVAHSRRVAGTRAVTLRVSAEGMSAEPASAITPVVDVSPARLSGGPLPHYERQAG